MQMDLRLGGRPKGSTIQATVDLKRNIELATHDAVVLLSEVVSKKKERRTSEEGFARLNNC